MIEVTAPIVMGILNVTPDSFSDGGEHFAFEAAIAHAKAMLAEGVDIIDVGGESTRPGAERVTPEVERDRVIPVITELANLGATVSVDTMRASIAIAAIGAGATYINDVSGGLSDPEMAHVIAANPTIQYIAMHWRGHLTLKNEFAIYDDVVSEVKDELDDRVSALIKAGIHPDQIILDPGIGFSKTSEHNWEILRNLDRFMLLGFPLLVGVSRKRFLADIAGSNLIVDRENASVVLTGIFAQAGIWGVRTHTVKPHKEAISIALELI
jgi:dihydropteroate synthase